MYATRQKETDLFVQNKRAGVVRPQRNPAAREEKKKEKEKTEEANCTASLELNWVGSYRWRGEERRGGESRVRMEHGDGLTKLKPACATCLFDRREATSGWGLIFAAEGRKRLGVAKVRLSFFWGWAPRHAF